MAVFSLSPYETKKLDKIIPNIVEQRNLIKDVLLSLLESFAVF